jgi:uncharacterized membrane protein
MKLTSEERRKIYEEEKAKIEAEEKGKTAGAESSTKLDRNIAALLCYVGFWISGIVLLVLEQKNKFVRFHAMQSIVTFGILFIASLLLSWIPIIGDIFATVIGIISFVLWIIFMIRAYQGELFKLPVAGDIAEAILPAIQAGDKTVTKEPEGEKSGAGAKTTKSTRSKKAAGTAAAGGTAAAAAAGTAAAVTTIGVVATKSPKKEETRKSTKDSDRLNRTGRIAGYAGNIFWNIILLVFFIFFYQYVAWYYPQPDGSVNIMPFFTSAYFAWQPILITALIISIAGNIILIIYDKFWLRQAINCIFCIVGIIVIANLLIIFPFDFSVIPDIHASYAVPTVLRIVLIIITIGLAVGALVYFIKLVLGIAGQKTDTEEV